MEISDCIARLTSKDSADACAWANQIAEESRENSRWAPYLTEFAALLRHKNSLVRNRAISILAANARWMEADQLDALMDEFLRHITDEKPITARQCIQALPEIITTIVKAIPEIVSGIVDAFIGNIDKIIQAGVDLFVALIENLPTIIVEIVKAVPKIVTGIVDAIVGLTSKMADAGASLLKGLWNGISNTANWLWNKVKGWANGLLKNIKGLLGIHSPSTVFAGIGENMGLGLGEGFVDAMEDVEKEMQNAIPTDFDLEPVRAAANFDASAVLPSANLSVAATVSAMFDLMKAYLPQMGVRQIVTDTGAVIGWLAPEMDNALGQMQKLKVRYA